MDKKLYFFVRFLFLLKLLYLKKILRFSDTSGNSKLDIQTVKHTDHNCPVWRVCWNMLATMLISTGDDGCVRIWRSKCIFLFGINQKINIITNVLS